DYGRLSGWAIVALMLGVLSAAALAGPILWFIPVVAAAVAIATMRKITTSNRLLTGWHIALLGLLLALFFGMACSARIMSRRYYLEVRAVHFADKFMHLLQENQQAAAFQLTQPAGLRKPIEPENADPFATEPKAKEAFIAFLKVAPVKLLLNAGQATKINLLSAVVLPGDDVRDNVFIKYQIAAPADPGHKSIVSTVAQRSLAYGGNTEQWQLLPPGLRES